MVLCSKLYLCGRGGVTEAPLWVIVRRKWRRGWWVSTLHWWVARPQSLSFVSLHPHHTHSTGSTPLPLPVLVCTLRPGFPFSSRWNMFRFQRGDLQFPYNKVPLINIKSLSGWFKFLKSSRQSDYLQKGFWLYVFWNQPDSTTIFRKKQRFYIAGPPWHRGKLS